MAAGQSNRPTGRFPAAPEAQWREAVAGALRRSGLPESALDHTDYDGIVTAPLYTAGGPGRLPSPGYPAAAPFVRGSADLATAAAGWDARVRIESPDPASANAAILDDLTNGATSAWLVCGPGALPVAGLADALAGVHLDLAPVVLDAGADTPEAVRALLALAAERATRAAELRGSAGADPIGWHALSGQAAEPDSVAEVTGLLADAPGMAAATVDGLVYHGAGAGDAQEIGIVTAVGVTYLRALVDAGLTVEQALARLEFRFAVTDDQFASMAKLRAARRVWSRVAELSGVAAGTGQRQHAVTSPAMLTRRDPWVNMLRTTIGCFAAALGGARAITVLPFDAAIGRPDDFARRIARNTQSILHDESSLARVVDAGGGSWYLESLTDAVAHAAWDVFTDVERAGGASAAIRSGRVGELIEAVWTRRAEDIAHRRAPITGVSEFALVSEEPVLREPASFTRGGGPLVQHRYAEQFEARRDRSDAAPERPRVYLATLGPYAAHNARAGFAANLLQSGGIECVRGPVDGFADSGASVVCLCSSDEIYADQGGAAATRLRAAGAAHIWLAGTARVDGVDGTLARGVDAIAVLDTVLDQIGVAR